MFTKDIKQLMMNYTDLTFDGISFPCQNTTLPSFEYMKMVAIFVL